MDLNSLKEVQPSRAKGTYFRFHSSDRFERQAEHFFLNFCESQHTFECQYRYAGRKKLSGFYFGSSPEVVTCEELYFNRIPAPGDLSAESLLDALRAAGSNRILLKIDLDYPKVCDFTVPWIVRRFFTDGHLRARINYEPSLAIEWLKPTLTKERGGNSYTDGLGIDAWEAGFSGVKFPSVRAITLGRDFGIPFNSPFGRLTLADWDGFYGKGAEEVGLAQSLEGQLSAEHNVALFSGQNLIRSVSRYSWNDGTGFVDPIENPYYGVSRKKLESVRLQERHKRGIGDREAVGLGLLSDLEIEELFDPEYLWVSTSG